MQGLFNVLERVQVFQLRTGSQRFGAGGAQAQAVIEGLDIKGVPVDRGLGFQVAATELARDIHWLDGMLLVIITAITLFVVALLAIVIVRYNRRVNRRGRSG